jgi:uncharacterized protein YjbJ (UPF0337 family)
MPNEDELKGKFENLKGRAKQAAGSVTGDKELEAEGLGERIKGAVQEKIGQVKKDAKRPEEEDEEDDL